MTPTVSNVTNAQETRRVNAGWMKSLADIYGFVRQGMLADNVLARFDGVDGGAKAALNNMSSWISHCVRHLALGSM